ncbi:hypothetical protein BJ165DRAFT_371834 [Panaeolus papilionaceus]|nr:hypothetical protein BJ165DRAFT_371834 [Panaeolus papilionaceus]
MHPLLSKLSSLLSRKQRSKNVSYQAPHDVTDTTTSSIEHLPNEILEKIFNFCSSSDLFHLTHTSRHLSHSAIRVLYHNIPRMDADTTIDMLLTLCAYATSQSYNTRPKLGEQTNPTHSFLDGSDIPSYIHSLSLVFTDQRMCQPLSKRHSTRLAQLNKIHRDRQLRHAKSISLSFPMSGKSGTVNSGTYRLTPPKSITLSLIPAALTNSLAALTTSYISIVAAALSILSNLDHLELKLQFPEGSDRHLGKLLSHSPVSGGAAGSTASQHPPTPMPFQLTSFSTTLEFGECMASFLQTQRKLKELTVMHVRKSSQAFWKEDMLRKQLEGNDPSFKKALPELTSLSYSDRTPIELVQYLAKGRPIEKLKVSWTDVSSPNNHVTPPPPHPQTHSPQIPTTAPAYVNQMAPAIHLAAGTINPNSITRLLNITDDPKKVKHVQCAFQRSHGGSARGFSSPAFTSGLFVGSTQLSAIAGTLPSLRTLVIRIESMDEDFLHHVHTSLPLFNHLQKLSILGSNACASPKLIIKHGLSNMFQSTQVNSVETQHDHWDWDGWGLPTPHGTPNLVELDLTHCLNACPANPFASLVNQYMVQCPALRCVIIPALPLPSSKNVRGDQNTSRHPRSNTKARRSNESVSGSGGTGIREQLSASLKNSTVLLNPSGAGYWVFHRRTPGSSAQIKKKSGPYYLISF